MKEAYSPVSGCSRKSHYKRFFTLTFDQMAPTLKEDEEEEGKKSSIISSLYIFFKWENLS